MRKAKPDSIVCEKCLTHIGVVNEVEDPARLGFYRNVPVPDPMPTVCLCGGRLTRIIHL